MMFIYPTLTSQKMGFKPSTSFMFLVIFFLSILTVSASGTGNETVHIGAIIDLNSRPGKEHKVAIEIAAQKFNDQSRNQRIYIHFRNISMDPLRAAFAAEELIREKHVRAIIGMQTWEETASVAEASKRFEVPIFSLASSSVVEHETVQFQWPFLVQMNTKSTELLNCVASIVHSYHWRKVIVIYEDGLFGGDSVKLSALSDSLIKNGTEIEHHLVLPKFSSFGDDSKRIVRKEVLKLLEKRSRVFIVLRLSPLLAGFVFKEANEIGLMSRDSAWILTDSLSNLLDSLDSSFTSYAQGALGIKNHYVETSESFREFKNQFQRIFRSEYRDDDHSKPGIYALQAYDTMDTIARAITNNKNSDDSTLLLRRILSSNFTGLSGEIHFQHGARSMEPIFRIVNVVGMKYKQLGFWTSKIGFSNSPGAGNGHGNAQKLSGLVNWPGELDRIPKGWAMPTNAKPLKIGVPGRTMFEKFVKVDWGKNQHQYNYDGFCVRLFEKAIDILKKNYTLDYEFNPYNGTYPDLVQYVANETYDAIVGDITILEERLKYMDFTQPYAESGLTMVVPVKYDRSENALMFLKPFSRNMWLVTAAVLLYTMFIIWFIEHISNPEFEGPRRRDQLVTALWFTLSSLFFAHKEQVKSNYTKVLVGMWLFVVFVITSSYQASLTSMLTVPRLEPNVKDIEWIQKSNVPVGCDGDSFVKDYLRNVLKISNIKVIGNQYDYPELLKNGTISAAFLETPYAKIFLNDNCDTFTSAGPTYRFGGLGFAFQKGSPLSRDFSEAILTLLEDGRLQELEKEWLGSSPACSSKDDDSAEPEPLSLSSFWGLYVLSSSISTICFLIFVSSLLRKSRRNYVVNEPEARKGVWIHNALARPTSLKKIAAFADADRFKSSKWELVSPSDPSQMFDSSRPTEIEITASN